MRPRDWRAVAAIYAEGLAIGDASFETEPPTWERFDAENLPAPRLVATAGGEVVGWAALAPVSGRCVDGGVAEDSVYVATAAHGRAVGRRLLEELVARAEAAGIWTVQAGIFPENEARVRLHLAAGFRVVGRERLGQHRGVWRDVLLLEHRSAAID